SGCWVRGVRRRGFDTDRMKRLASFGRSELRADVQAPNYPASARLRRGVCGRPGYGASFSPAGQVTSDLGLVPQEHSSCEKRGGQRLGEHFDRDSAIEARVPAFGHLTHAARADLRGHFVDAETGTGG